MPLRTAIDDLREITLAALQGRWQKLLYFARLRRQSPGKYSHWGFEQKHGQKADAALRQIHAAAYREVLRAPIPELLEDCQENRISEALLIDAAKGMVPIDSERQSETHFNYVLASVKALMRAKRKKL